VRTRAPLRAALLLAAFILAGTALAAQKVYNFRGGVQTRADKGLTDPELAPQPSSGSFFSWTYTFMFLLDDDSSGMIQFTYWKMLLKTQRGLYFAFSDKGRTPYIRKGVYKGKEMTYANDPPAFRMGPHAWSGTWPDFAVRMDFPAEDGEPELRADLRFRCRTPGWRPGEGPVHYGEPDGDWYDLVVMIPWAEVTGTLTLNGQTRALKGFGYADHNTQNIFPTKQTVELMALRSFSQEHCVDFLDYVAPEAFGSERTAWILVMKGDRILYATDKWERDLSDFAAEPKRGYRYPRRVQVRLDQPGCQLTGEVRGLQVVGVLDAIEELPGFLRPIVRRFASAPVFIRQLADVDWHLVVPAEGIDERFSARGIYETAIVK